MKVCPTCNKTYTDDNLNFCLDDGAILTAAGQPTADNMPATVFMNQPQPTNPQTSFGNQPQTQQPTQPTWGQSPSQYVPPPRKKSRAWIWILGGIALLLLLCGGGFGGLIAIGLMFPDENNNKGTNKTVVSTNTKPSPAPSAKTIPGPLSSPDDSTGQSIDLSVFVNPNSLYGDTSFSNGELSMASKQKDFYYVVVAGDEYSTTGATTKVTLRNPNNGDSRMGYGLVFHSDPKPLQKDYAFLLNTKTQKYRVVRHEPGKEISLVSWTNSNLIKSSDENVIEARDKGDETELYINGQLATSVKNTWAYKGGVPGLYTGDTVKILFKDFKIIK